MKDTKVSFRYASSLLDNAIEKKNLPVIAEDMKLVLESIYQHNDFKLMLKSPVIKAQLKTDILKSIFKDKICKESLDFLVFIVEKNREMLIPDIVFSFLEMKDEYLGILNVQVSSAVSFTKEQEESLRNTLESKTNKKVKFTFKIDSSLIGGFIARIGDTLYDASIKHQLEILKKQLLHGSASLN